MEISFEPQEHNRVGLGDCSSLWGDRQVGLEGVARKAFGSGLRCWVLLLTASGMF